MNHKRWALGPASILAVVVARDRQLPLRKRLSIRLHVSMCGFCRRYEKQLHLLRHGFTCYADPEQNLTEKSLSPEAKAKLEKALADSGK